MLELEDVIYSVEIKDKNLGFWGRGLRFVKKIVFICMYVSIIVMEYYSYESG